MACHLEGRTQPDVVMRQWQPRDPMEWRQTANGAKPNCQAVPPSLPSPLRRQGDQRSISLKHSFCILCLIPSWLYPPLLLSVFPQSHRLLLGVRCGSGSGSPGSGDDDAPPVVRAAVSAATELLRALSPKKPRQAVEAVNAELESPRSVEEVVAVLEADYRRAYFLTGM